jgi:hypothetical protein
MGEKADILRAKAKGRANEKAISYAEALREIGHELPDLCHEVREEIFGRNLRMERVGPFDTLLISHNPQKQLHSMVQVRMSEKGIAYTAALTEICREHPKLYDAAREQSVYDSFSKH